FVRHRNLPGAFTHAIYSAVAPHEDQPRGRVPRRPVFRPVLQRLEARILKSLLRRVHVAEITQQRCHRLRTGGIESRGYPGGIGHVATFEGSPETGLKTETGRIS